MIYVLSVSGGKDSTALWLWAKRTGLGTDAGDSRQQVAQDTGWEFDGAPGVASWREYLADLVLHIGESLSIVQAEVQFEARVRAHNTFPGVLNRRWCTEELKLAPMRAEIDRLREIDDVTIVVGVRAEESAARAKMAEREWSDFYDCEVWRPLLTWSLEQVIAEHTNAGVPMNPLYHHGFERVGCFPCIKASKAEIAGVARLSPERINRIRQLEADAGNMMFVIEEPKRAGQPRKLVPYPIDEIVKWARTERGGKRLALFPEPRGCARWGLCELPPEAE